MNLTIFIVQLVPQPRHNGLAASEACRAQEPGPAAGPRRSGVRSAAPPRALLFARAARAPRGRGNAPPSLGSTSGRACSAVGRTERRPGGSHSETLPSRRALGAPAETPAPDREPHGGPDPPGSPLWHRPLWLLVALGASPSQSLTRAAPTPQGTPAKHSPAGAKNRSTVLPGATVEAEFLNDSFKHASTSVPL